MNSLPAPVKEYEVVQTSMPAVSRAFSTGDTRRGARANAFAADWDNYTPPRPAFTGVKTVRCTDFGAAPLY